jgi:hypothetical protein
MFLGKDASLGGDGWSSSEIEKALEETYPVEVPEDLRNSTQTLKIKYIRHLFYEALNQMNEFVV